ncbi:MAG: RelE/StbE family addiction module toxin [Candidatus Gottesmanbacteria bacterium GW2011_GWA2_43_14]|uniref:RelE/StbE family addiction module toxin n=1 Tax=Candidatus Gottesmanbacteria bacterium GW2011_GWA2_43_14 TaxID=1618443 RepID=A0A0G1DFN9_9BACT|nr:MAG: RelE/StbE family addiction module toxin [Candidatus Gottesmanbacteria bacterium GW2011_GWA2_43_14]
MYTADLTKQAVKSFKKIPKEFQKKIKEAILKLEQNPLTSGTIKLANYPVAEYRKKVGDYSILFDLDDDKKLLIIADIKRRTSTTYQ